MLRENVVFIFLSGQEFMRCFLKGMIELKRCAWVNLKNPLYVKYHDEEWGRPLHDDQNLFELLILETFQAGLSWECVLNKREAFRKAYEDFDVDKVASFNEQKQAELLENPAIIRNKLKVKASVQNAAVFKAIQKEFGSFDAYIWHFTEGKTIKEEYRRRTFSPLSDAVSDDLKKRGMKFVGTTVIYSYLQSMGVINGHGDECQAE